MVDEFIRFLIFLFLLRASLLGCFVKFGLQLRPSAIFWPHDANDGGVWRYRAGHASRSRSRVLFDPLWRDHNPRAAFLARQRYRN